MPRHRLYLIRAGFLALAFVKLFLITGQARYAIGPAVHDDALFVRLASHLAKGEWLGPYDSFTLIKGVGYPLWIAGNSFLPLPLYVAEHLFYIAACLVFVSAIRPIIPAAMALVLFGLLLFNPFTTGVASLRFIRESIYPSQALLFAAFMSGLLARATTSSKPLEAWALGLGLVWGFLWITREEGVWIVPALVVAYLVLCVRFWHSQISMRRRMVVLTLPLIVWGACLIAVSIQNYRYYGLFATNELKRREFVGAYGTIARVRHAEWRQYVPVPRETMRRIFQVSPTFQRLQPVLDGDRGQMWGRIGRNSEGLGREYAGEIPGGWFIWAFREAAQRTGHYSSPQAAMQFYESVAAEVQAAIDAGILPVDSSAVSLAPPWRAEYFVPLIGAIVQGADFLVGFEDYSPEGPPSAPPLELMQEMSGDRLVREDQPRGRMSLDEYKLSMLSGVGAIYQAVMPIVSGLCLTAYLFMLIVPRFRRRSAFVAVNAVLLSALFARLTLLGYIDISSFRVINTTYLSPLYPLLLAFCGLVAVDVMNAWRGAHGPDRAARNL